MIALALTVVVAVLWWRYTRRRRADRLAGLDGAAPTYTVAPPARRLDQRSDYRW